MIRFTVQFIILLLFVPSFAASQETVNDTTDHPLDGFEDYLRTDELVVFWLEDVYDPNTATTERKLFSQIVYGDKTPDMDQFLFQEHETLPERRVHQYDTEGFEPRFSFDDFHRSHVDVVTGDFNGDDYETFVGGYAGDGAIHFVINDLDPERLEGDNLDNFDMDISEYSIQTAADDFIGGLFRMYAEDLTRNGRDEIILAYRNDSDYIIEIFTVTDDLELSQIADYNMGPFPDDYSAFDIAAGKMTLSNTREIIFSYAADGSSFSNVIIETKIFYTEPNGDQLTLIPGETRQLYDGFTVTSDINISTVMGDFTGNVVQETAVGFNMQKETQGAQEEDNLFVRILDLADESLEVWPGFDFMVSMINELSAFSMASGDIDGTGQDEIVVMNDGRALILKAPERPEITDDIEENDEDENGNDIQREVAIFVDQSLDFSVPQQTASYSSRYVTVSDVNQRRDLIRTGDSGFTTEIIALASGNPEWLSQGDSYNFWIEAFGIDEPGQDQLSSLFDDQFEELTKESDEKGRSYAIAGGDFTQSRIRYENPRRSQLTDINQPWIILKAPPTHFDKIGETIYDVNNCFGDDCGFRATFTSVETEERSVSTSVESDWTVDASVEGAMNVISFGMSAKYGERFGHSEFKAERETFTQSRTARDTDQVYAAITTFDLWEYDVYDSGEFAGTVLAVFPTGTANTWMSSDSFFAYQYRSLSEETNLLSYPRNDHILESDDDDIDILLKGLREDDPNFSIDGGSSSTWSLEFSDFVEEEEFTESNVAIGGSLGFEPLGLSLGGSYSTSELQTNRMSVGEEIKIEVELGSISSQFPTAQYIIYPYAYWHRDGPLVIDYAVRLDKQLLGGPSSFWDERYGDKPDPAIKLPWRHLREKSELRSNGGDVEFDEDLLELTKSISVLPERINSGDTVTVDVDVHNFSLVELEQAVDVHLYLGKPESGERITFLDGDDKLQTDPLMPIRGQQTITAQFVMPETVTEPRLFAVLDPDDAIDEIHTSNNRGFIPLSTTATVVGADPDDLAENVPSEFQLHQNYPNPFNPATNIRFDLPEETRVVIDVFDVLGRRVATLTDQVMSQGTHSVTFDADNLTSGVYLYRIQAGSFTETKKMMLLK